MDEPGITNAPETLPDQGRPAPWHRSLPQPPPVSSDPSLALRSCICSRPIVQTDETIRCRPLAVKHGNSEKAIINGKLCCASRGSWPHCSCRLLEVSRESAPTLHLTPLGEREERANTCTPRFSHFQSRPFFGFQSPSLQVCLFLFPSLPLALPPDLQTPGPLLHTTPKSRQQIMNGIGVLFRPFGHCLRSWVIVHSSAPLLQIKRSM